MFKVALVVTGLVACSGEPAEEPIPDAPVDQAAGAPTAAEVFAAISACDVIGGKYALDGGSAATVDICALPTAVFWKADMDVDCDGKMSAQCNASTDPSYQGQTAATDSMGDPLDAAMLPYVVFPAPSMRFDFRDHALAMGSVVAVIYEDRIAYGVAGDTGPVAIIGEASYAMADALGINPDPSVGGTDGVVGYVAFTGTAARVTVIEDHAEAISLGTSLTLALVGR